jgi:hypothetical protein
MHPNFAGGERGDNEALSAHTKALLDWVQQRFLLVHPYPSVSICRVVRLSRYIPVGNGFSQIGERLAAFNHAPLHSRFPDIGRLDRRAI